jgi:hypothetical protein
MRELDRLLDGFVATGTLPMVSAAVWKGRIKVYEYHGGHI